MDIYYDRKTNSFFGGEQNSCYLGQVMWHITNKCRLNCSICFTREVRSVQIKNDVSYEELDLLIKILSELGVKKIDLSGGEPLLYPDLPELTQKCLDKHIEVTVTTSGVGLKHNVEWVSSNWEKYARVIVSLDGDRIIHNELRGYCSAFEECLKLTLKLKEHSCKNLRVNTVVTQALINVEQAKKLCKVIASIRPQEWCIIEPYGINKTKEFDSLSVNTDEFHMFTRWASDFLKESEIKIITRHALDYQSYWALYPDGNLYFSTNGSQYDVCIPLSEKNIDFIMSEVNLHKQRYVHNTGDDSDERNNNG